MLAGEQALTFKAAHFTWQVRRQLSHHPRWRRQGRDRRLQGHHHARLKAQDLAEKWLTAGAIVPNVSRKKGDALMKSLKIPKSDQAWIRALRGKDLHNGALVALTTRTATCWPTLAAPAITATT